MRATIILAGLVLAGPALAQDAPAMRGGEWTVTVSGMPQGPHTHTMCMADASLDKMANQGPPPGTNCSQREMTKIPGGVKFSMTCGPMTMNGTYTSAGPDAFRSDAVMVMQGGPTMHMVTDAKRTGPCKPGDTPVNGSR